MNAGHVGLATKSTIWCLLSGALGALFSLGSYQAFADDQSQEDRLQALEARVQSLESLLIKVHAELGFELSDLDRQIEDLQTVQELLASDNANNAEVLWERTENLVTEDLKLALELADIHANTNGLICSFGTLSVQTSSSRAGELNMDIHDRCEELIAHSRDRAEQAKQHLADWEGRLFEMRAKRDNEIRIYNVKLAVDSLVKYWKKRAETEDNAESIQAMLETVEAKRAAGEIDEAQKVLREFHEYHSGKPEEKTKNY